MEQKLTRIQGKRGRAKNFIYVDGIEIFPQPSLALRRHSPDGFNWGYGGSGPAQTALAILLHVLKNKYLALALYQAFKFSHVASWPGGRDFDTTVNFPLFLSQHPDQVERAKAEELLDVCEN